MNFFVAPYSYQLPLSTYLKIKEYYNSYKVPFTTETQPMILKGEAIPKSSTKLFGFADPRTRGSSRDDRTDGYCDEIILSGFN